MDDEKYIIEKIADGTRIVCDKAFKKLAVDQLKIARVIDRYFDLSEYEGLTLEDCLAAA